jgi:hypothetical protein
MRNAGLTFASLCGKDINVCGKDINVPSRSIVNPIRLKGGKRAEVCYRSSQLNALIAYDIMWTSDRQGFAASGEEAIPSRGHSILTLAVYRFHLTLTIVLTKPRKAMKAIVPSMSVFAW